MKNFDEKEYKNTYDKKHYKQFKAKLKIDELNKLNELLKASNLNKTQFIKIAMELLKDGNFIMKKDSDFSE